MKIAIVSDIHFGDPDCQLAVGNEVGPKYAQLEALLKSVGELDFLVLSGDVLDFSVASYQEAMEPAKAFFDAIKRAGITKEIIYLAGNHDADIWQIMQFQRSVINRVAAGKLPEELRHSVPALLDDRPGSATPGLTLHGVKPRDLNQESTPCEPQPESKYGGMFLDKIAGHPVNFAYPNLFVLTDQGECVMVTHGQYLEPYWAILSECVDYAAGQEIQLGRPLRMEDLVAINFPFNQLGCSGIGQAGVLTSKVVGPIKQASEVGDYSQASLYLSRSVDFLLKSFGVGCLMRWLGKRVAASWLDGVSKKPSTRYREDLMQDQAVMDRLERYFASSCAELVEIGKSAGGVQAPRPTRLIFGHTHQPTTWKDAYPVFKEKLLVSNTGGWLVDGDKFCGAEVFIYESGKGFRSEPIK